MIVMVQQIELLLNILVDLRNWNNQMRKIERQAQQ